MNEILETIKPSKRIRPPNALTQREANMRVNLDSDAANRRPTGRSHARRPVLNALALWEPQGQAAFGRLSGIVVAAFMGTAG